MEVKHKKVPRNKHLKNVLNNVSKSTTKINECEQTIKFIK